MKTLEDADSSSSKFKVTSSYNEYRTIYLCKTNTETSSIRNAEVIWFVVGSDQLMLPEYHQMIRESFDDVRRKNHTAPCMIVLSKSDLLGSSAGGTLRWRMELLRVLGLTPDLLSFDSAQLSRLMSKRPWCLDPHSINRGPNLLCHKFLIT